MSLSGVSGVAGTTPTATAAQPTAPTTSTAAGPTAAGDATTQSPTDTISLSSEAQQALATAAPTTAAAAPASSGDAVEQAVATLNDSSGDVSAADQLKAYELLAQFVANGQSDPSAPGAQGDAVSAMYDSAFGQHAQQLVASLGGQMNWDGGDATADSIDSVLTAFDALSPTDQQTYVGMMGLQHQIVSGETPVSTVADYRANLQARADVERALQSAEANPAYASQIGNGVEQGFYGKRDDLAGVAAAAGDQATVSLVQLSQSEQPDTDAWTQQVQAYFAQYGPPPPATPGAVAPPPSSSPVHAPAGYQAPNGQALAAALAAVNDTTGKVALSDQISAYQTLSAYSAFGTDYGPARSAVTASFGHSPFMAYMSNLQDTMSSGLLTPGLDVPQAQLNRLDSLSANDQQAYLGSINADGTGGQRFASLDGLKANLTAQSGVQTLENNLLGAYGVDGLSQITDPSLTGNPAFQGLLGLFSSPDWMNDAWTQKAQQVLDGFKSIDLAGPGADPTTTDTATADADSSAARALKILTSSPTPTSSADIGLAVLQNTAKADSAYRGAGKGAAGSIAHPSSAPPTPAPPAPVSAAPSPPNVKSAGYQTGDRVSVLA